MKIFKFSFLIILFIISNLFSGQPQYNTNIISNYHSNAFSGENHKSEYTAASGKLIPDEYGESGFNSFLGGLDTNCGYFSVPDNNGYFNLVNSGTIEAWIFIEDYRNPVPVIASKGDSENVGFRFYTSASENVLGFKTGNISITNSGGIILPLKTWTHTAVTWSGYPGNYTISFYVNGDLSGTQVINKGNFNSTSDSLTIGCSKSNLTGSAFHGFIDEVKIWSISRTQTQIARSRFTGIGDYPKANTENAITSASNYSGLLSSWTFNQNIRDDIGGKNGFLRNGAGPEYFPHTAGYPIPYNYALFLPGYGNSYVSVTYSNSFNLANQGTAEAWIYPTRQTVTHMIISIGTAGTDFFLAMRKSIGNRLVMTIGGTQFQNSDGIALQGNRWTHICAGWISSGSNYTVTFYVNGIQSGTPVTMPANWNATSGTLRIGGWHGGTGNNFSGYLDEVRIWSAALTESLIKDYLFTSCISFLPDDNLIAAWNFDGNLKNFSSVTGIDGTFSTGGTNDCYISAYKNESTSGKVPDNQFEAFPTVLNCESFPKGFIKKISSSGLLDNAVFTDTIKIQNLPGNLYDIQVFLAIHHQKTSDLTIKLKSPDNTEVILSEENGGTGSNGYLTILDDSTGNNISGTIFLAPWTNYAKPQNPMQSFGNTTLNGNWTLQISDGYPDNTGTLLGWGLRFNNWQEIDSHYLPVVIPGNFYLHQNYPNPFNPVTKIKIDIPESEFVKLVIYDILGRKVKTLANEIMNPGFYVYEFSSFQEGTSTISSGIYFCKMTAGNYTSVRKMTLIK